MSVVQGNGNGIVDGFVLQSNHGYEDLFAELSYRYRILREEFRDFALDMVYVVDKSIRYMSIRSRSEVISYIRRSIKSGRILSLKSTVDDFYSRLRQLSDIVVLRLERYRSTKCRRFIADVMTGVLFVSTVVSSCRSDVSSNSSVPLGNMAIGCSTGVTLKEMTLLLDLLNGMSVTTDKITKVIRLLRSIRCVRTKSNDKLMKELVCAKVMLDDIVISCDHSIGMSVD